MLQFLKDTTFKANDVFRRAMKILKSHYISVAGLCFLLFVTSNLSTFLAVYLSDRTVGAVKVPLLLLFLTLFFGLQLILIKRAILLSQHVEHTKLRNYIPSFAQFLNFIFGLVMYSLLTGLVYLLISVLCFPLLYAGVSMDSLKLEINPFLTGVVMMLILIRISFFPFFILEKQVNVFRSFRLSVALTRGNVINLLLLMLVLASAYFLQLGCEYMSYVYLAKFLSLINTFVIIPSVSLVMAIAYTNMMKDYHGGDDPRLFKNII